MPLLVGLDGVKKMSKSYDNYIAFNDSPRDIFGKIMSISDSTMWDYYKLLDLQDDVTIEVLKKNHPMEVKKDLAYKLTALFYGDEAGLKEKESFSSVFTDRENPKDMEEFSLSLNSLSFSNSIIDIIYSAKLFDSKGQIRRLIQQGAIKIDGQKVDSPDQLILNSDGKKEFIIKAGKKIFLKVVS
jgi:tyrosyl-tRNA synthetase